MHIVHVHVIILSIVYYTVMLPYHHTRFYSLLYTIHTLFHKAKPIDTYYTTIIKYTMTCHTYSIIMIISPPIQCIKYGRDLSFEFESSQKLSQAQNY